MNRLPGVVYPPDEIIRRYEELGVYGGETLRSALWSVAADRADAPAIDAPDLSLTHGQLDRLSDRIAAALLASGLAPRDRVLLQFGAGSGWVFPVVHACWKAGLIPVCTLGAHRKAEIGAIGLASGARAHIVDSAVADGELIGFAKAMRANLPDIAHLLTVGGGGDHDVADLTVLAARRGDEAARLQLAAMPLDMHEVAAFQLSGGTTGTPKIIPRTHADYLYNMRANATSMDFGPDTVCYWPFPATHNAAMGVYHTPALLAGGKLVVQPDFSPDAFLATIERHRVTVTGAFLPLIVRIIASGRLSAYDLSSVRHFASLGEGRQVEEQLGLPAVQLFGMAEGTIMHTRPDDPPAVRHTMVGRPISPHDEVRILKPGTEEPVAEGETGEFCARGPYTIRGYYNAEEHNALTFTADGFYRSGDLMSWHRIDGTVNYRFEGRLKDNIDRAGEKIHAEEIEALLRHHPAIMNVAVIGMPCREFGERVCAYVIPAPNAPAPDVAQIAAFLAGHGLAKFKWPERIEIRDEFPTIKVGKTSKALLREDIRACLAEEGKL